MSNLKDLKNDILTIIDKLSIVSKDDLFRILRVEEKKVSEIITGKIKKNMDQSEAFNLLLNFIESNNRYSLDFMKFNNYYISMLNQNEIYSSLKLNSFPNEAFKEYANFIDFFSSIAATTTIEDFDGIKVNSRNTIYFTHLNKKLLEYEVAKLVHYRRGMDSNYIINSYDKSTKIKTIIILINNDDINFYKDIKSEIETKVILYSKSKSRYLFAQNIINLKEKLDS